jgi:hypothetical protein
LTTKQHNIKTFKKQTLAVYKSDVISAIYLSLIFSHYLAVRSHIPSDNGFIVVKESKLGKGWARIGSLPLVLMLKAYMSRL